MTRKEEIIKASVGYQMGTRPKAIGGDAFADMIEAANVNPAFIAGAEWADQNPNTKLVYTKQDLLDMGFAFDLNGNIATPQEVYKDAENYYNYLKSQWIEKACDWLRDNLPNRVDSYKEFKIIEDFRKAMEEHIWRK